jgi:hypothetical protein
MSLRRAPPKRGAMVWPTGALTGISIRTLLASTVDYTVFTPGSDAGVPINIIGSLAAPKLDWATESEAILERISGTVAALLGLAGVNADPMRSREGILLANIFEHAWRKGEDLDLEKLINQITTPPVKKLGAFDVDTFYPAKDRFEPGDEPSTRCMASPTFQSWLTGEPLDVRQHLYFTVEGKPRHSIFYIAHLSDSERMFFVTLLLEYLMTWMRRQSGTTSLRALLYFDEIFGYFPPTGEPPSKRPLLTLLKQARAFGLGCRAGDAEPGRHRLQGADQRRHLVYRQAAGRARQGAGAGRSQGRHSPRRQLRSDRLQHDDQQTGQPYLSDAQRP